MLKYCHVLLCCLVQGHWNNHAFINWWVSADLFDLYMFGDAGHSTPLNWTVYQNFFEANQ